ncbi:uncharacterized protein LOC134844859 [Symsagittifera roscoffensis]|uniref:uncharacterized protein LOC134844859 n=1 Tax=Symsagittifera roscoffensis TaxID=84072 RepID=UPI00307B7FD0
MKVLGVHVSNTPATPLYPDQFTQNFTEIVYEAEGSYLTTGTYIYDWTNLKYSIERENGRHDIFCQAEYPNTDTPCSHIIVGGNRFLSYPDMNDCCYCCDSSEGCGLLKPDWLSDATFQGTFFVHLNNGSYANTYKWKKDGNEANFYYETMESSPLNRTMVEIFQSPSEAALYDIPRLLTVDSEKLSLPPICSMNKTCSGVCALVRSNATPLPLPF